MKKLNKMNRSHSVIKAAQQSGTTYYRISEDMIEDVLENSNSNLILSEAFKIYGLNAFDVYHLYGSIIDGDELYLCKTDGQEINIDGEMVDPEEALEEYGINKCSAYIKDGTPDIIRQNLSEYELNENIDIEEVVISLLQSGFSFREVVSDAYDLDLVEI